MDDIKSLVTLFYDTWNSHDRDGWLTCCDEDITFNGPEEYPARAPAPAACSGLSGRMHFQIACARSTSPLRKATRPSRKPSSRAGTRRHFTCLTIKTFPQRGRAWQSPLRWALLT
jgi:hypothetical protein